jgi:hypothetical protein
LNSQRNGAPGTGLTSIPIQIAAIAIYVSVLAAQFPAFMLCRCIVSAVEIAPQLPAIVRDFGFIVPDVAPIAPSVLGKHRSSTQSNQQEYPSNCLFHISTSLQFRISLTNPNTEEGAELRCEKLNFRHFRGNL